MAVTLSLTVNGKAVTATVDPRTLLVELIRNQLGLTGTHVGCDTGQCGACTVLLDGRAVKHEFWMGADSFGRDIWSRVLYGTRISLIVGLFVALVSLTLGGLSGLCAGSSAASARRAW